LFSNFVHYKIQVSLGMMTRWKERLTFYKSVFVCGGGTRQDSELGPDLINPLLLNL